jgi:hypothetical protein
VVARTEPTARASRCLLVKVDVILLRQAELVTSIESFEEKWVGQHHPHRVIRSGTSKTLGRGDR